jgi:hypothetical protein
MMSGIFFSSTGGSFANRGSEERPSTLITIGSFSRFFWLESVPRVIRIISSTSRSGVLSGRLCGNSPKSETVI